MKAAVYHEYGAPSVVSVQEVPKPAVKAGQLRIKVHASAVTAADSRIRAARFPKGFGFIAKLAFGYPRPKKAILGSCYSGVVDAVGDGVTAFTVGDEVTGMNGIAMGAHAEYIVVKATGGIAKKPSSVSHEDAAGVVFGGTAALYFLRNQGAIQKHETILVNGASGAVGSNAVQLAHYFGATVTAVCSGEHEEIMKDIGASTVIDYTKHAWDEAETTYDVILDAVGTIAPKQGVQKLTERGRLLLMVPSIGEMLKAPLYKKVKTGTATEKGEDIAFLLGLLEDKKLKVVVDSVHTLDQIVQAHERADSKGKIGNVIVKIA